MGSCVERSCCQATNSVEPGTVLPAQHDIGPQGADRVVLLRDVERCGRTRTIRIDLKTGITSPDGAGVTAENIELEGARGTELLEVAEVAAGQQRLDVRLQTEVRREDPVDTRIQRKRLGREFGKDVPAPERRAEDRVRYGLNVLGSAASPTVGRLEAKLDVAGRLDPGG